MDEESAGDIRISVDAQDSDAGPFASFASANDPLASRFPGDYRAIDALERVCSSLRPSGVDRDVLRRELTALHVHCDADEATEKNIALLASDSTLVVATGQQPGFMGGPLYTVFKAITAVSLARRYSERLRRPVVPVFWIASDDHDLPEVESATVLSGNHELSRIRAAFDAFGAPLADQAVSETQRATAESFLAACSVDLSPGDPATAFLPSVGERWSYWFGRILLRCLRGTGLVILDPSALTTTTLNFFDRELASPGRTPSALEAGARALVALGQTAPLPTENPSSLFITLDGRRQRFDPTKHTAADVARARATSLSGLSGDASLRPILQSSILPVIGVVGGPGEYRYWAQLREAFAAHEVAMPLFVPRFRATMLWPSVRKLIDQLGLPEAAWKSSEAEALESLRSVATPSADDWASRKAMIERSFEELAEILRPLGGSVPSRVEQAKTGLANSLSRLLEVAAARERESLGLSEKRRRGLAACLRPFGKPQERILAALPFALRFGIDLFPRLETRIDPFDPRAAYVELRN